MIWSLLVLQPSWIFSICNFTRLWLIEFLRGLIISMRTENTLKEYLKCVPQNYQIINSTQQSQLWFQRESRVTKDLERTLQYIHYYCWETFVYIFPNMKIFFTGSVAKHWNRMTREFLQLKSLEVFERGIGVATGLTA